MLKMQTVSAAITAGLPSGERVVLIMRQGSANAATNHSPSISIPEPEHAAALVPVKSVQIVGVEDVYDLSVLRHHNFSVAGGLIVHNCMDAARYLIKTTINQAALMRA